MQELDTTLLRTFITLAETRNFTHTAQRMHRSQSATSMQIAKLEQQLGCSLFTRTKRSVKLTAEGERLSGYARQILGLSDDLVERFRSPDMEGEVSMGSPEDFATNYLPEVLGEFARSHKRVALQVNCDLTMKLIQDFEKERYHIIVIKQDPSNIYRDASSLWRERLVWVGSHPLQADANFRRTIAQLCDTGAPLPLILSPAPCVYRQRAIEALDRIGVPWNVVYTSPSFAGAIAAVRSGLGITVFPRKLVPSGLVPLESEHGWPKLKDTEICLLARPELSPAAKALAAFITKRIAYNQSH